MHAYKCTNGENHPALHYSISLTPVNETLQGGLTEQITCHPLMSHICSMVERSGDHTSQESCQIFYKTYIFQQNDAHPSDAHIIPYVECSLGHL